MIRNTLIDLAPVELKHYSFMIGSYKCNRSCTVFSPKICVPKNKRHKC